MITYISGSDNLTKGSSTAVDAVALALNSGTNNLSKGSSTAVDAVALAQNSGTDNLSKGSSTAVDAVALAQNSGINNLSKGSSSAVDKFLFLNNNENLIGVAGAKGFGVGICPGGDLSLSGLFPLPGTSDINSDEYGNYYNTLDGSVMCWIPVFYYKVSADNAVLIKGRDTFPSEAEANASGYALHRAFIDGGVIKNGFFIDKYKWSLTAFVNGSAGIASSIQNGNPISSAIDTERGTRTISTVASDAGSNSYKITTSAAHNVSNNTTVVISGTGLTGLDATHLINYTRTIGTITSAGTTATVTTTEEHGLETGDSITVSGTGVTAYNITATITKVDATNFTYPIASTTNTKNVGTVTYNPASAVLRIKVTGATSSFSGSATLTKNYAGSFSNCISNSQTPTDTYGGAWAAAKSRGSNFALWSMFMHSAIAMLSLAHGQAATSTTNCAWYLTNKNYPKGNNNSGADIDDATVTFSVCDDGYWASRNEARKNGSGSTFAKTTHNGQACGVADINGDQYQVAQGLTAIVTTVNVIATADVGGTAIEVQTASAHGLTTNDWVMLTAVGGTTTLNDKLWKVTVTAADKFTVASGSFAAWTSGGVVTKGKLYALKEAVALKNVTGGNSVTTSDHFNDTFILTNMDEVVPNFASGGGFAQKFGNSTNQVIPFNVTRTTNAYKLSSLGMPDVSGMSSSGTNLFGTDYFYQYLRDELCPLLGASWGNTTDAGVWCLSLNFYRAYSYRYVSGRGALYVY